MAVVSAQEGRRRGREDGKKKPNSPSERGGKNGDSEAEMAGGSYRPSPAADYQ